MDTWADKGAKMDSDAGDDNWEKKSSTPEASNKNDPWAKSENTWDKRKGDGDAKQSNSWDGWNVVPAENSQGTTQWKETTDSGNKDWKADGWGAKSGNWSSQRNNPRRPPRRPVYTCDNGNDYPYIAFQYNRELSNVKR
ncbi:unnamed protein product [Miscanthus lutarioriparius]|uniref:Uncharacterized protein n=1 Tax=Miscanthus lutarioriparius TaxID=422564 RepID=A0A811QCZ4_9POAL|nr:unnamed protein product [Miscanthus lutarioriparius]